jgi:hypothetical protein
MQVDTLMNLLPKKLVEQPELADAIGDETKETRVVEIRAVITDKSGS